MSPAQRVARILAEVNGRYAQFQLDDTWALDFMRIIAERDELTEAQERTIQHIERNVFGGPPF